MQRKCLTSVSGIIKVITFEAFYDILTISSSLVRRTCPIIYLHARNDSKISSLVFYVEKYVIFIDRNKKGNLMIRVCFSLSRLQIRIQWTGNIIII